MNVLILGGGGREHALALKVKESPQCNKLFISPGNGGTPNYAENVSLTTNEDLLEFCKKEEITLVIVGPEKYLVDGTVDFLRSGGVTVFGPGKDSANIEADKLFAKELMVNNNVPTGIYKEFTTTSSKEDIYLYLKKQRYPIVIKANGLAAGKGVAICRNIYDALDAVLLNFDQKAFGEASNKILVEEFLTGEEASLFVVSDGEDYLCLPTAQDHKRIGNNDTGKNTGGMGAYAPAFVVSDELLKIIEDKIVKPTLLGLKQLGTPFIGCLFCGLILTKDGPKVIEFNARFGDPETQVVVNVIEGDFLELLYSAAKGKINKNAISYNGGVSVCIVTASNGYPDDYETNFEISGLDRIDDSIAKVYHAGTVLKEGKLLTNGGRVLGVTSFVKEKNFDEAVKLAYKAVSKISYDNIYYRTDIGKRALNL
ncbi:MAG: phosphoribosylamine--glycine ligase [Ignavibacteriaceae bacterium]|nr:phosphoribosylamine--glycine ligase [Ignavibacteriaceae bacterium]